MESGEILDSNIIASSYHRHSSGDRFPKYARLYLDGMWASAGWDSQPWIQTDLGSSHVVTGLQTAGNNKTGRWSYWVEQIKVRVGMNESSLVFINDSNGPPKVSMFRH